MGKTTMDKRVGVYFTKSLPHANKGHSFSLKLNYYHQLTKLLKSQSLKEKNLSFLTKLSIP